MLTHTQNPLRAAIRPDAHDLLLQLLSQLDQGFAAIGLKIEQRPDGYAISSQGKVIEAGLTAANVYERAILISHGRNPSERTGLDASRREAAYGAFAEHVFPRELLGWDAWEFPTPSMMALKVYMVPSSQGDPDEARFEVHFVDATSACIATVGTPGLAQDCAPGEPTRDRMRA